MSENPQNEYLKAKIMTATPQQLQTMLYDGAIRFCEQAKQAIIDGDIPTTHARFVRGKRIVVELSGGLNPEMDPELCSKMAGLYNYVYRLLVDASVQRDASKIDEALGLLHHMRETWLMAMEKVREQVNPAPAAAAAGQPIHDTPMNDTPMAGGMLSVEG